MREIGAPHKAIAAMVGSFCSMTMRAPPKLTSMEQRLGINVRTLLITAMTSPFKRYCRSPGENSERDSQSVSMIWWKISSRTPLEMCKLIFKDSLLRMAEMKICPTPTPT